MSKMVKVIIAAVICIALGGAILIGVFAVGGGREVYEVIENGGIGWSERGFHIGSSTVAYEQDNETTIEDGKETSIDAKNVDNLHIELQAGEFVIETADVDEITVLSTKSVKVQQNGNSLSIETPKRYKAFGGMHTNKQIVEITLPKDSGFHTIDIEVGAGTLEADLLQADEISVEAGAGRIVIGEYKSKDADISVGAGEVIVENGLADEMDFDVGMGSLQFEGTINRELDADCGMGNMDIKLTGEETDYNYEIDCAMGEVSIGNDSYGGTASGKVIDNGADSEFDLDCGMGNISIRF